MDKVVLDTSIIIKWFIKEEDSARAIKILEKVKRGTLQLVIPQMVLLELANALFWGNNYEEEAILRALLDIKDLQPELVLFDFPLIKGAVKKMTMFKIAAYDAFFITVAEQMEIPLLTADTRHHQKKFSKWIRYLPH